MDVKIRFIDSLQNISAADWNALCGDYPFTRYEFLHALEASKSVATETGWQPQHLLIEETGQLIGAVPLYVKFHSYGEYVFDWAWADAYKRYGFDYYPKLISAIPFTPCTGPRFLMLDDSRLDALLPAIIAAIKNRAQQLNASGWHCLFPSQKIAAQLAGQGLAERLACQFHWYNRNYQSWDDFVAQMTSRKRKNINKERRQLLEQEITFSVKEGVQIAEDDWELFYQLYCNTYLKRSGHNGYLTQHFFKLLSQTFASAVVMVIAQHRAKNIAAALFFKDSTTLYGRYWGCIEEYDYLHFETCYYQGIEYAINNKLNHFDGGAQGEHKIQRGFEPVITHSNHWLARSDFHQAIFNFVQEEAKHIAAYQQDAISYLPFKES